MASQFPLAPAVGQTFTISGVVYEYNATLGWVRKISDLVVPTAPTDYLRGASQFTDDIFTFRQVYDNIYDAYANNTGVFRNPNNGNPAWNTTTYATSLWGGLRMINVGPTATGNHNLVVTVPAGAVGGLMWLRVINDGVYSITRENTVLYRAAGSGNAGKAFWGSWTAANSFIPRFSPYSGIGDAGGDTTENHIWLPLVLPDGATSIEVEIRTGFNTPDGWISGLAFTDNPKGLAITPAIQVHRQGDAGVCYPVTSFQWHGGAAGNPCAKFTGRFGDGTTTANTANATGPKKFALQCDINGKDKRVLVMTLANNMELVRQPPNLKAANGTWITPEQSKSDLDWVSFAIKNKIPSFCSYWTYDVPAADIAASPAVNNWGGTLNNAAFFQMHHNSDMETVFPYIFTYDA